MKLGRKIKAEDLFWKWDSGTKNIEVRDVAGYSPVAKMTREACRNGNSRIHISLPVGIMTKWGTSEVYVRGLA